MSEQLRTAVVIPTYGAFDYAARAVRTALANTTGPLVILVDDASPGWGDPRVLPQPLERFKGHPRFVTIQFCENQGLTAAWNAGLKAARGVGAEYTCVTNSDVLFPRGWDEGLTRRAQEYALVGPVSNAPGVTSRDNAQDVKLWYEGYQLSDDDPGINVVSEILREKYPDKVVESPVNGFCMLARTETWWAGAYARGVTGDREVFNERVEVMPSGRKNPTPRMTGQEDELQARWRALGMRSAVVPSSFVFHYRSVSRGDRHKKQGWYRMKEQS